MEDDNFSLGSDLSGSESEMFRHSAEDSIPQQLETVLQQQQQLDNVPVTSGIELATYERLVTSLLSSANPWIRCSADIKGTYSQGDPTLELKSTISGLLSDGPITARSLLLVYKNRFDLTEFEIDKMWTVASGLMRSRDRTADLFVTGLFEVTPPSSAAGRLVLRMLSQQVGHLHRGASSFLSKCVQTESKLVVSELWVRLLSQSNCAATRLYGRHSFRQFLMRAEEATLLAVQGYLQEKTPNAMADVVCFINEIEPVRYEAMVKALSAREESEVARNVSEISPVRAQVKSSSALDHGEKDVEIKHLAMSDRRQGTNGYLEAPVASTSSLLAELTRVCDWLETNQTELTAVCDNSIDSAVKLALENVRSLSSSCLGK